MHNSKIFMIVSCALVIILAICLLNSKYFTTYYVKPSDTVDNIVSTQLKDVSYLPSLLEYNGLMSVADIKTGMTLKIPFNLTKERYANVVILSDKVNIKSRSEQTASDIDLNNIIKENYTLSSGKEGKALIEGDDGSKIRVLPKTQLQFSEYKYQEKNRVTIINIQEGKIYAKLNHFQSGDILKFKSEFGEIKAGCSHLHINVDNEKGKMIVLVKSGSVEVKGISKSIVLNPGFGTVVSKDGDPLTPYKFDAPAFVDWVN